MAASDVGGTFTDLVLWDGRRLHTLKKVTDPKDRQRVVREGTLELLARAGLRAKDLARIIHGTTAATNAVLQRRGGRVGLVTNEGFEDLVEIARQNRPRLYDLAAVRPEPLVPRALRLGVPGRLDKDGRVLTPLGRTHVRRAAAQLRRAGAQAVAVCFLHSYNNPRHEHEAARILAREGVPRISTSHDVAPEVREYERFTTTIVNAFLQPVFEDSLRRLDAGFKAAGARAPVFVVESSGGMVSAAEAQRLPVRTVLSGPAGGVAAAGELAKRLGVRDLLTFDMGGTSTDMAILRDGRPATRHEAEVAGFPLRTPAVDLTTIGAGGGSLARLDPGGILTVGPESAEAWPGPACYGRGGTQATVTDADVLLGRIEPRHFLTGSSEVRLEPKPARRALARLGDEMGLGAEGAARAVLEVATANLHRGIRLVTTERGLDPADYALVAFGGAGPLHGIEAARELGIRRVVVPPEPAVFSAWGMLVGEIRHSASATRLVRSDRTTFFSALRGFAALERETTGRLRTEGFPPSQISVRRFVDLRYAGQSYELTIPLASRTRPALRHALRTFHREHQTRFGHSDPRGVVELVTLRAEAAASPRPTPQSRRIPRGAARPPEDAWSGERRAHFHGHGTRRAPIVERRHLRAGNRLDGPLIVEGGNHTFLLPPKARARVSAWGDCEVTL